MSEGGAKFVEEEGVGNCLPALVKRGRRHSRKVIEVGSKGRRNIGNLSAAMVCHGKNKLLPHTSYFGFYWFTTHFLTAMGRPWLLTNFQYFL